MIFEAQARKAEKPESFVREMTKKIACDIVALHRSLLSERDSSATTVAWRCALITVVLATLCRGHALAFPTAEGPRTAIVVVDMQPTYLAMMPRDVFSEFVASQTRVLQWANQTGAAILVFEMDYLDQRTIPELRQLIEANPRTTTLKKCAASGFRGGRRGSRASDILEGWDVDRLIIMGVNASRCVRETIRGALRSRWARSRSVRIETHPTLVRDVQTAERSLIREFEWGITDRRFIELQDRQFCPGSVSAAPAL